MAEAGRPILAGGGEGFADASAFGGDGADDEWSPGIGAVREGEGRFQFTFQLVGAVEVGLVEDEDIGNLHNARLEGLNVVAVIGREDDKRDVGEPGDFDFVLADADGFDDDDIAASGVEEQRHIGGGWGKAAEMAAGGHGADEDAGVRVVLQHADAVAEDGAA